MSLQPQLATHLPAIRAYCTILHIVYPSSKLCKQLCSLFAFLAIPTKMKGVSCRNAPQVTGRSQANRWVGTYESRRMIVDSGLMDFKELNLSTHVSSSVISPATVCRSCVKSASLGAPGSFGALRRTKAHLGIGKWSNPLLH